MNTLHQYLDRFKSIVITLLVAPIAIFFGTSFYSETGNWWETPVGNIAFSVLLLMIGSAASRNIEFKEFLFVLGTISVFRLVAELILNYADYFGDNLGVYGARRAVFTIHTSIYLIMVVLALIFGIYLVLTKGSLVSKYSSELIIKIRNSRHKGPVYSATILSLISFAAGIYGIFLQGYNFRSSQKDFLHYVNLLAQVVVLIVITLVVIDFLVGFLESQFETFRGIFVDLNDTSIEKYITRRLSSWLYAFIRFALIVGFLVASPYLLRSILVGDFSLYSLMGLSLNTVWWIIGLGSVVLMPIALVIAYVFIFLIRFAFEYSNAIIHIAQNTTK